MDTSPETPLVVTSSADDQVQGMPGTVSTIDSKTNFADDVEARAWVDENVVGLLEHVRSEYGAQHEEWANIRRMANVVRDQNASYNGQSRVYVPVYQRALETRVSHTSRGLFPSDTYLDADPVFESPDAELAKQGVKEWMTWQLETSAKLRAEMKPWLRTLYNYGTSIAKVWWEKPPADLKQTKLKMGMGQMIGQYGNPAPWQCEGLRFKSRNPFAWYIWPVTVGSIGEASLVFEDIQVSRQFVDEMLRKGHWKNKEDALNGQSVTPVTNNQIQQTLVEQHASSETAVDYKQGQLADWRYMSECWFRMKVPDKLYIEGEDKNSAVPVKAVITNGVVVELRRNPFWHQMPPYLMMRLNENQDSFYSTGMGRSAAGLQYLVNDFLNQTNDNGTYALNPIVKVNPNLIVGPLEPIEPGRIWNVTDPAGVEFDRPPVEQIQYGMQMTNMLIGYLNDMSGAPAVLQGSGDRGGAKTATGAQILQGNVKGDLQDIIEDIELRVLTPLMIMAHSLGQQYERAERWFAISGQQKTQFKPGMLELDYMWRWVASSQTTNQQMRAQQLGAFLQLAGNPGVLQLLMQQGKMLNPEPVLRKFWEDGLGQRNFDSVVRQLSPQEQMMMAMQQAQAGSEEGGEKAKEGAQQPGGGAQEPRSATEQAPGGGGPMQPGEGEALGAVRQEADMLAAVMGGATGGMS